jgi:hypothetical protein
VKGVGPVLAKKLVGHFGAEVLGGIGNGPADLESVDGIRPRRRDRIADAWQEGMQIREIMLFLHIHGVSTGLAVRIYKTYGNLAIQTVRENPYTLAKEIHGIGFATADQIAQSVGIPKDSQIRALAGIDHVPQGATSEGHCALPFEKLMAATVILLEVPVETIEQAVSQMLTSCLFPRVIDRRKSATSIQLGTRAWGKTLIGHWLLLDEFLLVHSGSLPRLSGCGARTLNGYGRLTGHQPADHEHGPSIVRTASSGAQYVSRSFEDRVAGKGHGEETRSDIRTEEFFAEK